jgi:GntR family transcriptional regulator, transcriptional repressor for pyruvate dehydrogenase complex
MGVWHWNFSSQKSPNYYCGPIKKLNSADEKKLKMFKTARVNRISQNIVEQIRENILAGKLKPGDRLPSEKELSLEFGVSKASLREALRALESLGMLEVKQGMNGGAFVKEVDLETARNNMFNYIFFQNPSIGEFTQLRNLIEPQVAEIAAGKITAADLNYLEHNLSQTRAIMDSGPFYYELDTKFHHRIAQVSGNRLICFLIDSLKNAIVNIKLQLELDRNFSIQVYEAHLRIFDALRKGDPQTARKAMHRHIIEVDESMMAFCDGDSLF